MDGPHWQARRYVLEKHAPLLRALAASEAADRKAASPIPEGSMRVGPGTDAVVWRTCPTHKAVP